MYIRGKITSVARKRDSARSYAITLWDRPISLERRSEWAYDRIMDHILHRPDLPPGWLEIIAEGEADIAAGRIVPGDGIKRGLLESIARIEAKRAARGQDKAATQR